MLSGLGKRETAMMLLAATRSIAHLAGRSDWFISGPSAQEGQLRLTAAVYFQ